MSTMYKAMAKINRFHKESLAQIRSFQSFFVSRKSHFDGTQVNTGHQEAPELDMNNISNDMNECKKWKG